MINSKFTKTSQQQTNEEKLFKLLESMDWKLWEMYNMMKDYTADKNPAKQKEEKTEKEPAKSKSKLVQKLAAAKKVDI